MVDDVIDCFPTTIADERQNILGQMRFLLKLSLNLIHYTPSMSKKPATNGHPQGLPLNKLPAGVPGRVAELNGQADACQRLREMGFCESSVIQKVSGTSLMICQVCGTRIALSDRLAQHIIVTPIQPAV
jgi:ferrous iron transport protein A